MDIETSQQIFNEFLTGDNFYHLSEKYNADYNLIETALRLNLTSLSLITSLIGLEVLTDFVGHMTVGQLAEKYNINPFGIQEILRDTINNLSLADVRVANVIFTDFS